MLPKTRLTIDRKLKVTVLTLRAVAFVFLFLFSFCNFVDITRAVSPEVTNGATTSDQFGIQEVGENIVIPANPNSDIRVIIVRILNVVLGFLGLVAVCIILYAGYLWMTSAGNEEQVAQAKKMLINGVVGMVIILSAFGITSYILRSLIAAINGTGATNNTRPPISTYSFSGSLGSVIKDHYPKRDQQEIPRNTSIVVTFGVPIAPASLIENSNRTCWGADGSGPTLTCKTTSGADVASDTPLDQIANPYYGDCIDANNDTIVSIQGECDRLNTAQVVIDERVKFSGTLPEGQTLGRSAAALTTYDAERNAFTFVFRPYEYLGSPNEDVQYRVRLNPGIMRADNGRSVFENQFSDGYAWDFTTGNILDLTPPHVVDTYPEAGTTVPKNSIIQIIFDEPIDPTTVEGIILDGSTDFSSTLLNQLIGSGTQRSVAGAWRLSNGYTTLEFTPSQECGTNSCGEKMFCLAVECTGTSCTNSYDALLRTAEWTRNNQAPFEAIPFSGVYDLAFNGLDNESNNAVSENDHLIKPDPNTSPLIAVSEKNPDNYWWSFEVANTIDRTAPYIQEIAPGVDVEDVLGNAPVSIRFSKRMIASSIQGAAEGAGISLEEYPKNVCADAVIDTATPNECSGDVRLDDLWFRVGSMTVGEQTKAMFEHREFGPNSLDLYYMPTVPSTVKSVTQNCVYPGVGPWAQTPALPDAPSACTLTYDPEGNVVSGAGCVEVTQDSAGDTGCVYTLGSGYTGGSASDPMFRASTIGECIDRLHTQSPSSYQ
ncbi:MAG TPA: Ig-like domain-containing protein [Candidatus Magasanikbacteria bacterium]|nr:Ig-like domain-containing protein [Candidatus Magasanikbacteria bacterium]